MVSKLIDFIVWRTTLEQEVVLLQIKLSWVSFLYCETSSLHFHKILLQHRHFFFYSMNLGLTSGHIFVTFSSKLKCHSCLKLWRARYSSTSVVTDSFCKIVSVKYFSINCSSCVCISNLFKPLLNSMIASVGLW